MNRKLTRLQALFTGGAFALAGIGGTPAAALAADTALTEPATTAAVEQLIVPKASDSTDSPAPSDSPSSSAPASASTASVPSTAPSSAASAPSAQELHPQPITADQKRFTPDAEQLANAKAIVEAGKQLNLPPRAWTIAVATALQESNLHNLGHLGASNDHDSLGLFQQRPTSGWGTPSQIQDPNYSAKAFYKGLTKVNGWQDMPLTQAAQKVQVSAYPNHYAKHEAQAGEIINALYGSGPYADAASSLR